MWVCVCVCGSSCIKCCLFLGGVSLSLVKWGSTSKRESACKTLTYNNVKKRERESVCVCVCFWEREREAFQMSCARALVQLWDLLSIKSAVEDKHGMWRGSKCLLHGDVADHTIFGGEVGRWGRRWWGEEGIFFLPFLSFNLPCVVCLLQHRNCGGCLSLNAYRVLEGFISCDPSHHPHTQ